MIMGNGQMHLSNQHNLTFLGRRLLALNLLIKDQDILH